MKNIILILFLISGSLFSQSIVIKNVDASDYPNILVEVDAFKANGDQYRDLDANPLILKENGTVRTVTNSFCEEDAVRFSLLISIDGSRSMDLNEQGNDFVRKPQRRYDAILRSVEFLITQLDLSASEVSLFQSLGSSNLVMDFSQDRTDIINNINSFPDTELASDINAAFLGFDDMNRPSGIGTLQHAEEARWKPVVIFLSDGGQQLGNPPETFPPILSEIDAVRITTKANEVGAIIYNMNFGDYPNSKLQSISSSSGGKVFEKSEVNTEDGIKNVLYQIIQDVSQNPAALAPCEVNFNTDCSGGGELYIETEIEGVTVSATTTYVLPDNVKPDLLIDNRAPNFLNVADGSSKDFTIKLTAKDNKVKFTGFNSDDPRFTLLDDVRNLTLDKDEEKNVKVRFTADSEKTCLTPTLTFESSACSGNVFNPTAGWLNAVDVNVGAAILGDKVTNTRLAYENNTCEEITITNISIDNPAFTYNATLPLNIAAGATAQIEFSYEPTITGQVSSPYTITVGGVDYPATINGGGSGQPEIVTSAPNVPTVTCDATQNIIFEIENTGPVTMNVSSIVIDNTTDFTLNSPNTLTIAAGAKETVDITFNPANEGTKLADVTITSDATEAIKIVKISGKRNNVSAQANTLDIGVICPDNDYEFDIPVNNNGEVVFNATLSTSSSDITFPNGSTLALSTVGGNTVAKVKINSSTEGVFDADIVIEDECGDQQTVVKVTGEVRLATVDYDDISSIAINTNLNVPVTETIAIRNLDNRQIDNLAFSIVDNPTQFSITSAPTSVAAGGTANIEVEYLPTTQGIHDLNIMVTGDVAGNSCLSTQLPTISGATNIAEATITAGGYQGLIGQVITLDNITLTDDIGFASSGVTDIELEIVVNQRLLVGTGSTPVGTVTGEERTISYTYNVSNPIPITLLVTDPLDNNINSSDIIINTIGTVPANRAILNIVNGNFNLIRAKGDIKVSDYSTEVGKNVTITLTADNFIEVDANLHQKIKGELKFNASMLASRGNTDKGRVEYEGGIPYKYIPFEIALTPPNPKTPSIQVASSTPVDLEFVATFGSAEETNLELVNLSSEVGVIELTSPNIAKFTITNLCKNSDGTILMLWKSDATAPITMLGENPVYRATEFSISAYEDGPYKIIITDFNGNIVSNIYEGDLTRGEYRFNVQPNNYSQGTYYINLIAPSERFTKSFIFVK